MAGRRLIIGDIHASYDKLISVLDKASFTSDDILYSVGDIVDRGDKPVETLDFLMGLENFFPVLGNHDGWLESYLYTGKVDSSWYMHNGGDVTVNAIRKKDRQWQLRLRSWISKFPLIRILDDAIIVHGGIPGEYTEKEIENIVERGRPHPLVRNFTYDDFMDFSDDQEDEDYDYLEQFFWDRDYLCNAMYSAGVKAALLRMRHRLQPMKTDKTIWIGHTPLADCRPVVNREYHLVAIDTGSYHGKLTLVDMSSCEYWQA